MKKLILPFLILTGLVLYACSGKAETTSTATSRPAPTTVLTVPADNGLAGPESGCTVVTRRPTPGPTQQSLFPAVGENDWALGPADAKVTIIEYSDFQ